MKNATKYILGIGAVILLAIFGGCQFYVGTYNRCVALGEGVGAAWSQVENQYQRRYDLVPNLVATVKGYAQHEESVLEEVTNARSRAGGVIHVGSEVLTDSAAFERFQRVQGELGNALQRLLAVTEAYPDLKASANFLALQDQLEGTENRIAVERQRFNDAVRLYNSYVQSMPQKLIAGAKGFIAKPYFASETAAQSAPRVSF